MSTVEGRWTLTLRGKPELRSSTGVALCFKTRHPLLVLAVLSVHRNGALPRLALAQTVWPNASPKAARDSLRNALSELRKALPAGTLEADEEQVKLDPFLDVHGLTAAEYANDAPEFMEGFSQDWVVERRTALKDAILHRLVAEADRAWESEDRARAFDALERASAIDSLNEDVAARRVRFLDQSGQPTQSARAADQFRARLFRDVGVLSTVRPEPVAPTAHPLMGAAEWLLDRSPDELMALLAATYQQWSHMPIDSALKIHERALAATSGSSSERLLVGAQNTHLLVLAGKVDQTEDAEALYLQARDLGEPRVACHLATALAYGFLSRGAFQQSINYAKCAVDRARETNMPSLVVEAEQTVSIIWGHTGRVDEGREILRALWPRVEKYGSPMAIASQLNLMTDELIYEGQLDEAANNLEKARRICETSGGGRTLGWIKMGESLVYEAAGDLVESRRLLDDLIAMGDGVGGQAMRAMSEDRKANLNARMGAFDQAAEAFARASLYRRGKGVVASIIERAYNRQTRRMLAERLDERDWRAAVARAELAP